MSNYKISIRGKIAVVILLPFYLILVVAFMVGVLAFYLFLKLLHVLGFLEAITFLVDKSTSLLKQASFYNLLSKEDRKAMRQQ